MPQLTRGDIEFLDAPEPVLAFRRTLAGERSVLCVFNLGADEVTFTLPQARGAQKLAQPGLPGEVDDGAVTLPPCGGWFGYGLRTGRHNSTPPGHSGRLPDLLFPRACFGYAAASPL
jgi:hypothetical protein